MITLLQNGKYTFLKASGNVKALFLEKKFFVWKENDEGGIELQLASSVSPRPVKLPTTGKYRLYEVKGEKKLANTMHLELFAGDGKWEGYVLPDGLPTKGSPRKKIMQIDQTITKVTH